MTSLSGLSYTEIKVSTGEGGICAGNFSEKGDLVPPDPGLDRRTNAQ